MPKKSESHKENKGWGRRSRKAGRGEGSGNNSDYRQQIRAKKMTAGSKKNGCLPKLFLLVLPFIAVGAYLFLGL